MKSTLVFVRILKQKVLNFNLCNNDLKFLETKKRLLDLKTTKNANFNRYTEYEDII